MDSYYWSDPENHEDYDDDNDNVDNHLDSKNFSFHSRKSYTTGDLFFVTWFSYLIDDINKPIALFRLFDEDSYTNQENKSNTIRFLSDFINLNKKRFPLNSMDEQGLTSHFSSLMIK